MTLPRLATRLTATATLLLLLLVGLFVLSTPASAAATYTFYASGSAVGQTAPGVTKDYTLNLTNLNSSASISFNLSIVTSPVGWSAQLSQTSLTVAASATRQVTLSVQPPTTALADSVGQYVNVTATPDDNTTAQTVSTTTRVTEVFGVTVTVIPNAGTAGDPGQNITWLGYVKNTGNSQQTYSVNINNTSYTSTNLTTNLVTVQPSDTRVILITVNISATAPVGTLYSRLSATSNANASSTDAKDFAASVNAKRAVGLSGLTTDDLHAYTESEASAAVHNIIIQNLGNVADSYTLQGTANASRHGDWITFEYSSLALSAFSQRYLNVTLTVPASVTSTGDYTAEFRIISDNSTSVIAFLNLTVTVTAKHDLKLAYESLVSKQSGEPGTSVSFAINVSNPGAFDERVDLAYAGENASWVAISATPFSLAAGAFKVVYYNFSIPGTQVPGSFGFQVQGSINWSNPYRNRTVDLTLEVKQIYDVIASSGASAASGNPGATVTFTVLVRNNGTGADNFTVSATNATQAGLVTLSSTTLSLAFGASSNVTVSVAITSSPAPATGTYYYGVTVKSSGDASKASSVNLALTVNQAYALSASVTPSYQTGDPGTTLSYTVTVTNNGNGADTVTLQKAGVNQTWLAFPSGSGTVAGGGGTMNFTVQVTAPSFAAPGDTLLTVKAVSGGNASVWAAPTFTVSLSARPDFALSADTVDIPNAHRNSVYSATFTLRNSGNVADTFTVALSGADALWASLPVGSVALQPNENATFTVTVTTPGAPSNGAHAFTVNATSLGNASRVAAATFTVTVNDVFRPEVTLSASSFFALPNGLVTIGFTVRNNGTIADTMAFTATAHFPTPQVLARNYTLNPGASTTGSFQVTASYPYTGAYLVDFHLQSGGNASVDAWSFANITLEVLRAVDLAAAVDTQAGGPSDAVNYTLTLRNLGNITDTYSLSYTAPGPGWTVSFTQDNFTLAPGEGANLTAFLLAPASLAAATYQATIAATSATVGTAARDLLQVRFTVSYALTLARASNDTGVLPGGVASFAAMLQNTGSAADQYTLTPGGGAGGWAVVGLAVVALPAGASALVMVNVTVPLDAHDGALTLTLDARSQAASLTRQVSFTVTVDKVYGFSVVAPSSPVSVMPGQPAAFVITILNTGNGNDSYTFIATPPQYAQVPGAAGPLDALQSLNVTVNYTVPPGTTAGNQPLQVAVFGGGGVTATVFLNATVLQVYAVAAHGQPSSTFTAAGDLGTEVTLSFNLTNRGNGPDTLTWSLGGEAASWAVTRSGLEVLGPGVTALENIVVRIPADPMAALAGDRTLNVTVASEGGGADVNATVVGSVHVNDAPDLSFSLDGSTLVTATSLSLDRSATGAHDFTLYLKNLGNRVETVTLTRTPITGWTIAVLVGGATAAPIQLQPGEQKTATLRISAFPSSGPAETIRATAKGADTKLVPSDVSVTVEFLDPLVRIDEASVHVSKATAGPGDAISVSFSVQNTGNGTATGVLVGLVIDGETRLAPESLPSIPPGGSVSYTLTWTPGAGDGGKSHTITVASSTGATAPGSDVQVTSTQTTGLLAKVTTDRDVQLVLGLGIVLGLVIGLAARGGKRRRPEAAPMEGPSGPRAVPPQGAPESALEGLAALEAEGQGAGAQPAGPEGAQAPSGVEHKIVCPNCNTEQWIRGAEGECKSCGVIIEVSEEAAEGAPSGAPEGI